MTRDSRVTVLHDDRAAEFADTHDSTRGDQVVNPIQAALRKLFEAAGLDSARIGTPEWNPLGDILQPGMKVVIKPNLVHHRHYRGGKIHWLVTDPRLIRALCEYAFLAVGQDGQVIVGDAPLQSADWDSILRQTGLGLLPGIFAARGLRFSLRDFRTIATTDVRGVKCAPKDLAGDPDGYRAVNFGAESLHRGRDWRKFRVTNYDPSTMCTHHNETRHEYLISGSVLSADALINVPKLKTHRKSGLTGALKNLVGINGCKDWLPHHSVGSIAGGGDEFASGSAWKKLGSWIVDREERQASLVGKATWNAARKVVWKVGSTIARDKSWEGSWHGNDTLWRTILDLNRAAIYSGNDGVLRRNQQRAVFTIVDAILAGEGEGPMAPTPVPMGCLIAGSNPVAVDTVAARLACWPESAIKTLSGAWTIPDYPLAAFSKDSLDIRCYNAEAREIPIASISRWLRPTSGFEEIFESRTEAAVGRLA
jgi:uncharacterized protein (DUF362 family)